MIDGRNSAPHVAETQKISKSHNIRVHTVVAAGFKKFRTFPLDLTHHRRRFSDSDRIRSTEFHVLIDDCHLFIRHRFTRRGWFCDEVQLQREKKEENWIIRTSFRWLALNERLNNTQWMSLDGSSIATIRKTQQPRSQKWNKNRIPFTNCVSLCEMKCVRLRKTI